MVRFRHCPVVSVRLRDEVMEAWVASGFLARLLGLAGLGQPPSRGLLLPRCRSVHTYGMRFPIDVLFLDGERIVRVRERVPPGRIVRGPPGRPLDVLELAAQSTSGATAEGAGRTTTRSPTANSSTDGSCTSTVRPASWRRR